MYQKLEHIPLVTETFITLLQWPLVGPQKVRKFALDFVKGTNITEKKIENNIQNFFGSKLIPDDETLKSSKIKARKIIDECEKEKIKIISIIEKQYPPLLRKIKDPPPLLYAKGSLDCLTETGCAVVGTRKASDLGKKLANKIGYALAQNGILTVSGLALGIDTQAHMGALKGLGKTVAILAHGLHTVYPHSNRKLADEIIDKGGALISELWPGIPPRPPEFVRRNRIQSGMSKCSVVVESEEQGGTIHTAKFTINQGRYLFAVIPEFTDPLTKSFNDSGSNLLINEFGAEKLTNTITIINFLKNASQENENKSEHADLQLNLRI